MLIPINELFNKYKIKVKGILHVGAHKCEELRSYLELGIKMENIYWIEAQPELVFENKINNPSIIIYQAVIDEQDDKEVVFNITNNGESSSILEFGSHETSHPQVKMVDKRIMKTSRLDTVIEKKYMDMEEVNFINLDIQGVELRALKSMEKYLKNIDYIYTEVNTEEVYKDCDQMEELTEYLKKFDFKLVDYRIYKQYGWGDAFYVREK